MLTKPYKHQAAERDNYKRKSFALFWEMGTGKTRVILENAIHLYGAGHIRAVMVVAPNGVQQNWILREVPVHIGSSVPICALYYSNGLRVAGKLAWHEQIVTYNSDQLLILALNYEAFRNDEMRSMVRTFMKNVPTMLVLDESHRIKTPSAKRTRYLRLLKEHTAARRILSGTPITQSPLDLYSQMKFLATDIFPWDTFAAFKARFAMTRQVELNDPQIIRGGPRKGKRHTHFEVVYGYHRLDEMRELILPHSSFARKKDCLDLPEQTYSEHYVELTSQQRRMYKELQKDAVTAIQNECPDLPRMSIEDQIDWYIQRADMVSTTNAAVRVLRLHQVLGGWVRDDNDMLHHLKNNRPAALLELLEDVVGKAIIWACFIPEVEEIERTIASTFGPEAVVQYYGGTSERDRIEAVDRFQEDPECRFFVGHPGAGGIGISLTAGTTVIWYSMNYNYEHWAQANDRPHRIGQEFPVHYIQMVTPGTVDVRARKNVESKGKLASEVLHGP